MRERARDIVVDWVKAGITSGRVRLGDRLPPERELAEDLGVSRTAVREAVQVLHALGIVRSGVGSGPTAGTVIVADSSAALGLALTLHVATGHIAAAHIVQVRMLLEEWAARNAVEQDVDLAQADALLTRMADTTLSVEKFLRLDASFHVALASGSGNPLVAALMDALRESISESTVRQSAKLPDWRHTADRLHREHREIFEAYRARDYETASTLLHAHIMGYYTETIGQQE